MADNTEPAADEASLLARLRAGDEQAYASAVKTYQVGMLRTARRLVGDSAAEEVVQDSWLAAMQGLARFEARASLKTWLIKIVTNTALSRLRRSWRELPVGDSWDEEVPAEDRFDGNGHWRIPPAPWHEETPEALLAAEDLRACLNRSIERLPDLQRGVLVLRDVQGLSMEEICNLLAISATNARVLLHRARTRLRDAVAAYERGENV